MRMNYPSSKANGLLAQWSDQDQVSTSYPRSPYGSSILKSKYIIKNLRFDFERHNFCV